MNHWTIRVAILASVFLGLNDAALGQETTSVPLQPYGSFHLIDVTINDRGPFKFVVDTAVSATILDLTAARELDLAPPEGSTPPGQVVLDSLRIGSADFAGIDAQVHDLSATWGEGSPSGVLGFGLFGKRLVTLDLPLQRLTIGEGALPDADDPAVLAYALEPREDEFGTRHVPTIAVDVAGKKLRVDLSPLGFGTLALPKNQMETLALGSEPGVIGRSKNESGTFDIFGATVDGELLVGDHRFKNPSVFFSDAFEHPSLGSGTLEPFVLTFDLGRERVKIVRPSGRENPLMTTVAELPQQSGDGNELRAEFNSNVDNVRLMVLLSPT